MAIHVTVVNESDTRSQVLLVDALGVSGGDRCHELLPGEKVDLWLSEQGEITLRQAPLK